MNLESTIFPFRKFDKVGKLAASVPKTTVNVDDFGAEGDGQTDDTKAFRKAWKAACSNMGTVFVVPQNRNYLLKPINGTLEASDDRSAYKKDRRHWLVFDDVENLTVEGDGIINGNGKIWWQNSCKINKSLPCKDAPTKVQAMDITCGPGHGISVGSLGSRNSKAYVSNIIVNGAELSNTTNGVRIKTWQGGSGNASNIIFQNIKMHNVTNPIIIDQNYCDQDDPCKEQKSAVQVKNVVYRNITGTSASDMAIKIDCSKSFPCQGIVLQDINITRGEATTKASCNNVKMKEIGVVSPQCHDENKVSMELHGELFGFHK
ncbi:hypothetical protein F0562_017121 [Nyssa sinensis]|uniref:Uncharacterized protein n=1 Tax=Nyssa sinensis TaxID=561372 RepID=A0A5J4ZIM4_9ASTE|nr:hypothetical protein F0562_017121 [Nyssa sinensis]